MLGLENTLRSLTASPVTAALNEVRRHARRYRLEAGGAAGSAHDHNERPGSVLPADVDPVAVVAALAQRLGDGDVDRGVRRLVQMITEYRTRRIVERQRLGL
jgi:hypothetical protein